MIIKKTFKYYLYFVIFIFLVQIVENDQFQKWFAHFGLKVNLEPLGTYAPLFLSVLLIDVTYQIGKQQNKIADRQSRIERHRLYKDLYSLVVRVEREANQLVFDLFNIFMHVNENNCKSKIFQKQSDLADCLSKLKASEVDFHILQFNQSGKIYVQIEELMELAESIMHIVSIINNSYANKIVELKYPRVEDVIEGDFLGVEKVTRKFIEKMIELNEMKSMHLVYTIDVFLRKRKELFGSENNILNLIKEEADADYHASC